MKKNLIVTGILIILLFVELSGCFEQENDNNVVSIKELNKNINRYVGKEIIVRGYYVTGYGGGDFVQITISEIYPATSDERQIIVYIPESVGESINIFQGSEYFWYGEINDNGNFIINNVETIE